MQSCHLVLQVLGKLENPVAHVPDPVILKFATAFEPSCSIHLKRTPDAAALSGDILDCSPTMHTSVL